MYRLLCTAAASLSMTLLSGELFRVGFDGYSVTADMAKGSRKCKSFKDSNSMLRMFPGVSIQQIQTGEIA